MTDCIAIYDIHIWLCIHKPTLRCKIFFSRAWFPHLMGQGRKRVWCTKTMSYLYTTDEHNFELPNSLPSGETKHSFTAVDGAWSWYTEKWAGGVDRDREINMLCSSFPRNLACIHVCCTKFIAKPVTSTASRISKIYRRSTTATPTCH